MLDEKRDEALLEIYLKEYESLKEEQLKRITFRDITIPISMFAAIGSAATIMGNSNPLGYYSLLVLPCICFILGWIYVANDNKVSAIGEYFRTYLANKLDELIHIPGGTLGWEITHRSDKFRIPRKLTQLLVDQLTFVFSGLFALAAFWWMQTEWHLLLKITWGVELVLLIWLSILIFIGIDI